MIRFSCACRYLPCSLCSVNCATCEDIVTGPQPPRLNAHTDRRSRKVATIVLAMRSHASTVHASFRRHEPCVSMCCMACAWRQLLTCLTASVSTVYMGNAWLECTAGCRANLKTERLLRVTVPRRMTVKRLVRLNCTCHTMHMATESLAMRRRQ